ncbi:MAG: hypothetical protein CK424_08275 [Legionella sp.]|nr:MAG: hypothetical protein CK424_08275 [Legionella sp.]
MKKVIFFLLCYTMQALASEKPADCPNYRLFEIYVKNNTESVCTIVQENLRRGYLKQHFYPIDIKPNEQKQVKTLQDYAVQGSDLVLSYQCGDNKFATIESERDVWAADHVYVKGWIWSLTGMNASYAVAHYGSCEEHQPAKIVWTLSEH